MKSILKLTWIFLVAGLVMASCKSKGEAAETTEATEVKEAAGQSYTVITDASKVMWEGTKVTGAHNGTVNIANGEVVMDGAKLTGGSFTIDMKSLEVLDLKDEGKGKLETHLKGSGEEGTDDFFNVNKYPTAKFEMTKATQLTGNEDANYIVNGNLTIKDVTKQISFRAMVQKAGDVINVTTPKFTIDRTEWGIKYGSATFFDGIKDKAINDNMGITIKLMAK